MKKIALRFSFVLLIVTTSLGTSLVIQREEGKIAVERANSLRRIDIETAEFSADYDRRSNRVAATKLSLSNDQFHELLKLRGEIGLLRENAREAARLGAAVQKSEASPPDESSILAYWPNGKLARAGYTDPISGLQTALWAINRNDPESVAASMALDFAYVASKRFEGDTLEKQMAAGTKLAFDSIASASGFYVVGQTSMSEDRVAVDVFFQGAGRTHPFLMMKKGDDWKLRGIFMAGTPIDEAAGFRFWP